MKKFNDIDVNKAVQQQQEQGQKQYNQSQNIAMRGFILSVYSLYGQKAAQCSQPENLEISMRTYAEDILSLTGGKRQERLSRIKKLKQAGHTKYQWPEEALSHGSAEHQFFIQDYHSFYPPSPDVIGNRNKADTLRLEGKTTDKATANQHVKNLKDMF